MINLDRLKRIKEKNADDSLRFVVDYILSKVNRDKSEFYSYREEEDWTEFDAYINTLNKREKEKDYLTVRGLIEDNEEEHRSHDLSFEKMLLRHLNRS